MLILHFSLWVVGVRRLNGKLLLSVLWSELTKVDKYADGKSVLLICKSKVNNKMLILHYQLVGGIRRMSCSFVENNR